jgi:phage terminase large subunit-like protein
MNYTLEATGLTGGFAYRYEWQTDTHHYFGYAETEAEALEAMGAK